MLYLKVFLLAIGILVVGIIFTVGVNFILDSLRGWNEVVTILVVSCIVLVLACILAYMFIVS